MIANLVRLTIWILSLVSVRSQYLLRFFFLRWIRVGHAIHPPIEGILPATCFECSWTTDACRDNRHFIARKLHFGKLHLKTQPPDFSSTHASMEKLFRLHLPLREKCLNSELSWSIFSCIQTE